MAHTPIDLDDLDLQPDLLRASQVAELFGVDPKTVTRWANTGRLGSIRTLGAHRRYRAAEVRELLTEGREHATR
ncbi:MAG: BldC family transcriptional regulator [Egibacteraceae bacterium]